MSIKRYFFLFFKTFYLFFFQLSSSFSQIYLFVIHYVNNIYLKMLTNTSVFLFQYMCFVIGFSKHFIKIIIKCIIFALKRTEVIQNLYFMTEVFLLFYFIKIIYFLYYFSYYIFFIKHIILELNNRHKDEMLNIIINQIWLSFMTNYYLMKDLNNI